MLILAIRWVMVNEWIRSQRNKVQFGTTLFIRTSFAFTQKYLNNNMYYAFFELNLPCFRANCEMRAANTMESIQHSACSIENILINASKGEKVQEENMKKKKKHGKIEEKQIKEFPFRMGNWHFQYNLYGKKGPSLSHRSIFISTYKNRMRKFCAVAASPLMWNLLDFIVFFFSFFFPSPSSFLIPFSILHGCIKH